jgi:ribosomal protein L11 methyltransferase
MAFGTGQHPTTKGCLELIEVAAQPVMPQKVLDVGTGSGILAIAMGKLGARRVYAIDNDPAACRIAAENAAANDCASLIRVTSSWAKLRGAFDLVVANLFTNLLCDLAPRLIHRIRPGGILISSGFLAADEQAIKDAYPGFSPEHRRDESGWTALFMRKCVER